MKERIQDLLRMYALFVTTVLVIYKLPASVGAIYQAGLLALCYRSRRDYFWLAFVILAEANIGGLFLLTDVKNSLALVGKSPFGALYFWMLFIPVALAKTLHQRPDQPHFLRRPIFFLLIYLVALLFTFGTYRFPPVLRLLLPWLLLLIMPRMLKSEEEYAAFFNLIIGFVPLVLITQAISIVQGGVFSELLGGTAISSLQFKAIDETAHALRPVFGIHVPFIALMGATFFATLSGSTFPRPYLMVMTGLSLFSIFLTATRSWMIASALIALAFLFLTSRRPAALLTRVVLPALLILALMRYSPSLRIQSQRAFARYETVELLLQGDVTAGGTLKRFDVRSPRVMQKFYESPVIGWGFGAEGNSYSDVHIGNQNMLMQTGLIGYGLFLWLWFSYLGQLYRQSRRLVQGDDLRKALLMLVAFLPAIFIIHTNTQWFGYLLLFANGFTIALLFSWANWAWWRAEAAGSSPAAEPV